MRHEVGTLFGGTRAARHPRCEDRRKIGRAGHRRWSGFFPLEQRLLLTVTPLALGNNHSGISVTLSGTNGVDWAVQQDYHDNGLGDEVLYLKSSVNISLAHNSRNTIAYDTALIPHVIGANGPDGVANSGDEGVLHYKIDRDEQAHWYASSDGTIPTWAPVYSAAFNFNTLTYDGTLAVKGRIGDNGAAWGSTPASTTARYCYGQLDAAGNEWHTLTYWDDDTSLYALKNITTAGRTQASDGHAVWINVNPITPIIQLRAPTTSDQFYTTPLKVYFVPKIWDQKSYVTAGVQFSFVNLTDANPVYYRINGGSWTAWDGNLVTAGTLFPTAGAEYTLDVKNGTSGAVLSRKVVRDPGYPAPTETHGNMLWANDAEKAVLVNKLHNVEPFKTSYTTEKGSYYQATTTVYDYTRGSWRADSSMASTALANAYVTSIEGPAAALANATKGKERLLRLGRQQPVGFELLSGQTSSPSKDYLSELGQTLEVFADAAYAYDLLVSDFRQSDHASGITPVEEIKIRDGLAKIASSMLQFRENYGVDGGGGNTHWALGYELAVTAIAMAMPTYKQACYGVSGGDRTTVNDLVGAGGKYWNPFPDMGVTWYAAANDAAITTMSYPNMANPTRADSLITNNGWWTGPNGWLGDGDRYFTGPSGKRLVDTQGPNMGNAEGRVEMIEDGGYESPFLMRTIVIDYTRRLRGDTTRGQPTTNYIRRKLVMGQTSLAWDATTKTYSWSEPRREYALYAFNSRYDFASLASPMTAMSTFLNDLNIYNGTTPGTISAETRARLDQQRKLFYEPFGLSLCAQPSLIPAHQEETNHAPVIKPLYKYVVKPDETVSKKILAYDPDDQNVTLTVTGLPSGATFTPATGMINWVPTAQQAGVYYLNVTATDGTETVSRPFPIIVSASAPAIPLPAGPISPTAVLSGTTINLSWGAPAGVTVSRYVIYRDGELLATVPAGTTTYADREELYSKTSQAYQVAVINTAGGESTAVNANPSHFRINATFGLPGITIGPGGEISINTLSGGALAVHVTEGTTTFTNDLGDAGTVNLDVSTGATATLAATQHLKNLTLASDAAVLMSPGSPQRVLSLKSLALAGNAALDLSTNAMFIDYTGGASPRAAIEALVGVGYHGGNWLGTGITSSTAAADTGLYSVGVLDNVQRPTPLASFAGVPVPTTAVLIRLTYVADLDLDGLVTSNDAIVFANNYSDGAPATRRLGDLNYNGIFDSNDAILFANSYNETLPQIDTVVFAASPSLTPAAPIALTSTVSGASAETTAPSTTATSSATAPLADADVTPPSILLPATASPAAPKKAAMLSPDQTAPLFSEKPRKHKRGPGIV